MYPIHTLRRRLYIAQYQASRYARAVKREINAIRHPAPGDFYTTRDHYWLYKKHMTRLRGINQFVANARRALAQARIEVDQVRRARAHEQRAAKAAIVQVCEYLGIQQEVSHEA